MIIGYYLSANDNDSFFLEDEKDLHEPTCPKCGYLLDCVNYFNPFFKVKRKNYDLSYTYDQRAIVSLRFKEFCVREGYEGLSFKSFEREPCFFQPIITREVEVDKERSKPRFENLCNLCGNFEGVYFKGLFLKDISEELKDEFYRTDILFSWGNRKNPLIIIAPKTYEKLKREKFKGLIFQPITV